MIDCPLLIIVYKSRSSLRTPLIISRNKVEKVRRVLAAAQEQIKYPSSLAAEQPKQRFAKAAEVISNYGCPSKFEDQEASFSEYLNQARAPNEINEGLLEHAMIMLTLQKTISQQINSNFIPER